MQNSVQENKYPWIVYEKHKLCFLCDASFHHLKRMLLLWLTFPQTSVKSESRSSPDLEESMRSKAVNSHPPSSSSDHAYLPEIIFFQFKTGTLTPTVVYLGHEFFGGKNSVVRHIISCAWHNVTFVLEYFDNMLSFIQNTHKWPIPPPYRRLKWCLTLLYLNAFNIYVNTYK